MFADQGDVQELEDGLLAGLVVDEDVDWKNEAVDHVPLVEGGKTLDQTAQEVLEGKGRGQVGDGGAGTVHQAVVEHFEEIFLRVLQG